MPRMKKMHANRDGWSEWAWPTMKLYRMGCCDCGLVHDIEFKVVRVTNRRGALNTGVEVKGHRVLFRARRNKRSTAQVRRHTR
jgi:Fe2+ or Zn2+ uptake regulation protein